MSSSSSSVLGTLAIAAISAVPLRLIKRTPCVALPIVRSVSMCIRIVTPDFVMIIKSSSSETTCIESNFPVFSVIFKVLTPFPPRFVIL